MSREHYLGDVEKNIIEQMKIVNSPNYFLIEGKSSKAHTLFSVVKKWAEKEGSEFILIKDRYFGKGNKNNPYMLVEISEPAASLLEGIIKRESKINLDLS